MSVKKVRPGSTTTSSTTSSDVIQISLPAPANVIDQNLSVNYGAVPAAIAYHHIQGSSSAVWEITHNLGFYPNVTTMDSSGSIAEGEITHIDNNILRVTFSAPFSGNAYLS